MVLSVLEEVGWLSLRRGSVPEEGGTARVGGMMKRRRVVVRRRRRRRRWWGWRTGFWKGYLMLRFETKRYRA